MSGILLNYPLKANSVADDSESFYHVLALFALRFHLHSATGDHETIKDILNKYDSARFVNGFWVGSYDKIKDIKLESCLLRSLSRTRSLN